MIILDVETSGDRPEVCGLASIGAIDYLRPERKFYEECRVFDGAQLWKPALAKNGFTPEQLLDKSKPTAGEIYMWFLDWSDGCADRTLAGWNPRFDYSFLEYEAERYKKPLSFTYRTFDLHTAVRVHLMQQGEKPPLDSTKLSALGHDWALNYAGLPVEPMPHNGLTGAKMEAEAIKRILEGKGLLPDFAAYPLPSYLIRDEHKAL